jgi:hypothetical protein
MTEASSSDERAVVAIDCDEVLAQFVPALAEWHNAEHGTSFQGYSCFKTYRYAARRSQHTDGARRSSTGSLRRLRVSTPAASAEHRADTHGATQIQGHVGWGRCGVGREGARLLRDALLRADGAHPGRQGGASTAEREVPLRGGHLTTARDPRVHSGVVAETLSGRLPRRPVW